MDRLLLLCSCPKRFPLGRLPRLMRGCDWLLAEVALNGACTARRSTTRAEGRGTNDELGSGEWEQVQPVSDWMETASKQNGERRNMRRAMVMRSDAMRRGSERRAADAGQLGKDCDWRWKYQHDLDAQGKAEVQCNREDEWICWLWRLEWTISG